MEQQSTNKEKTNEKVRDGLQCDRIFESDFPVMKTSITTTEKFGKLVSSILRPLLNDYSGCFITPGHGSINFSLYFVKAEYQDPKKMPTLNKVGEDKEGSTILTRYTARFSRKFFEVTEELKKFLIPLIEEKYLTRQNKMVNGELVSTVVAVDWNKIITEISESNRFRTSVMYTNSDIINVKISGIDIYKFLNAVYGKTDEDGNDIEYRVRFEAPLSPTYSGAPNRILVIDRIKKSDIKTILNYNGKPMRTMGGISKY